MIQEHLGKNLCFKPCYKWIPFNTLRAGDLIEIAMVVLNLVINGYPSIQKYDKEYKINLMILTF